jgi:GNAT superfamily N-acetyltransferase
MKIQIFPVEIESILKLRLKILRPNADHIDQARFQGDTDPGTLHFAALEGSVVVGCLSAMVASLPETAATKPWLQIRGMAVDPLYERKGIAKSLIHALIDSTPAVTSFWCNARLESAELYRKVGFTAIGDVFTIQGIGPHQRYVIESQLERA